MSIRRKYGKRTATETGFAKLSDYERRVFLGYAIGKSGPDLAKELSTSKEAINQCLYRVSRLLGILRNPARAMAFCLYHKIMSVEDVHLLAVLNEREAA